ncbi:hypothetical protein MASR2M48_15260 [Spirochaetota bacterium]
MIHAALSSSALSGGTTQRVLETAARAGLKGVEWTDLGYVPVGDMAVASETMMATLRTSLSTVSYATPFRAGIDDRAAFKMVLATACGLNTPVLSLTASPAVHQQELEAKTFMVEARYMGDEAARLGITLCFGIHPGSLLDSYQSAASLFAAIDHPFVKIAWEPPVGASFDEAMESFSCVSGQIGLLYIKAGTIGGQNDDKSEEWLHYLDAYDEQGGSPDMARNVVIRSMGGVDSSCLASDVKLIDEWSVTLRRYHRRRVL